MTEIEKIIEHEKSIHEETKSIVARERELHDELDKFLKQIDNSK